MEQKISFSSLAKYGLLLGLAFIILSLIEIYLKNFLSSEVLHNMSLIFMILKAGAYAFFIYCAIKFAVENIYTLNYSFAKGVKVALFVGLIAAVLITIYQYIEIKFIDPDGFAANVEVSIQHAQAIQNRALPEGMEEKMLPMMFFSAVFGRFFQVMLISLLASLLIAPFFKKRQPESSNIESSDN